MEESPNKKIKYEKKLQENKAYKKRIRNNENQFLEMIRKEF